MEDKIFDIVTDLLRGDINKQDSINALLILCISSSQLPDKEDLELFEIQMNQEMERIDATNENKEAWKMGFRSGFKIAQTPKDNW